MSAIETTVQYGCTRNNTTMSTTNDTNDMTASPTSGDAGIPDAAVVSLADAVSHALDSSQPNEEEELGPIPPPLPVGWVMRESRAQPNYYYYYNMETGESTWHSPALPHPEHNEDDDEDDDEPQQQQEQQQKMDLENTIRDAMDAVPSVLDHKTEEESRKRSREVVDAETEDAKRPKISSSGKPSKVRILHILKKHKGSRRPSSWRQAKITATKEEATEELKGLMEILQEESGEDQRATFEELARTESDCSSAKRGGDLGFFGPKKMQPAFEEASFNLKIGELSGIVETSSGVHVLLRIG
jgi:peptidyl-prolyl cis-trans isomerase NIMA-interacting 1